MQKTTFSKKITAGSAVLLSLSAINVAQAQLAVSLRADASSVNTASGSGSEVTTWNNSGTLAASATMQGSSGTAPIWNSASVNGSASSGYVTFNGVDDLLTSASLLTGGSLFSASEVAVFMVVRSHGNVADSILSWTDGAGTYLQVAENDPDSSTHNVGLVHGGEFNPATEPGDWDNNWHVVSLVRSGTAGDVRIGGVSYGFNDPIYNSTANTAGSGILQLGNTAGINPNNSLPYTQNWAGDVAEIRVYSSLTGVNVSAIETELGGQYNLAPVPEPSQYATVFSLICVAGALVYRQRRQRALAS